MKNIKTGLLAVALIAMVMVGMNGCKEVGPQLPWGGHSSILSDTTYIEVPAQAPQMKNVLVEELTGVSCTNCPQGHATLDQFIHADSSRIVVMAIHSSKPGALDESIPGSTTQIMSDSDGQALIDQFGEPGVRPSAGIDRLEHTDFGPPSIYTDRSAWGTYIATQLGMQTPINLYLTSTYDNATKTIAMSVEIHYTSAQPDSSHALCIFLTEDSIISGQEDGSAIDTFYVHNAILRKAVSKRSGDAINVPYKAGTVIRRLYSYRVTDPIWKPEHMHIVAFIHKIGSSAEVVQAQRASVK